MTAPDILKEGNTVLSRQHDIHQNQLRQFFFQGLPEGLSVMEALGLVTGIFQCIYDQFSDIGIIFYAVNHLLFSSRPILPLLLFASLRGFFVFSFPFPSPALTLRGGIRHSFPNPIRSSLPSRTRASLTRS